VSVGCALRPWTRPSRLCPLSTAGITPPSRAFAGSFRSATVPSGLGVAQSTPISWILPSFRRPGTRHGTIFRIAARIWVHLVPLTRLSPGSRYVDLYRLTAFYLLELYHLQGSVPARYAPRASPGFPRLSLAALHDPSCTLYLSLHASVMGPWVRCSKDPSQAGTCVSLSRDAPPS
jgi:hypothetical protein